MTWFGLALTLVVIAACFQLDFKMLIALAAMFSLCILNFLLRNRAPTAVLETPDHAA
ncbi:hypothetical protein D3C72_2598750 [compost metagenome]